MKDNTFVKHIECPACGSSDGNALYDDGHQFCHVCHTYVHATQNKATVVKKQQSMRIFTNYDNAISSPISDRGISQATCLAYGVKQDDTNHYYPYYDVDNTLAGVKVRGVSDKSFSIQGDWKSTTLFGQSKFAKGGRNVTIHEGELDALAGFQMAGSKYPHVSVKNGASAALKDCKANYEWLDSFETIYLSFDSDEAGQKAVNEVAELFGSKCKIVKHLTGFKDACDYLKAGKGAEYTTQWWNAESFKPEGIVTVRDIHERLMQPPAKGLPWAFPTLTDLTYGRRAGEIYGFGAGVGIGKTDFFTQQIEYDLNVLNLPVGVIYLEQNVVETVQRIAGKMDKRLYHVPDGNWTREQYVQSIDKLEQSNRLFLMEHFGSMEWSVVKNTIKYFAKAYDIKVIYLDHLTALSANAEDERRALDGIMSDMASLAQETGVIIHLISHLTTPTGTPHEEGGRVMEKHFTGSRAIARWCHFMFGLERDKQHQDPVMRMTTVLRCLKDRFTGRATAEKIGLLYDRETGILTETSLEEEL